MFSEASSLSENSVDSGVSLVRSFVIPEFMESVETLEYIGWGEEKATDIWARWEIVKQTESNEITFQQRFLEYALSAIPDLKLEDRQEDWDAEMLNWGVGDELRAAIMDEAYTNIRLTESAQYWVKDTMEIRYLIIPQVATSSTIPGRLILYKAIAKDRVGQGPTGEISIESLVSGTPSDFRGVGGTTLYFTPNLEVAEHCRGYIRRRYNAAAPVMLELSVPNSFIEALPPYFLRFGDLWKEIVYTSRRGLLLRGDLKRIYQLPLIIAPIACSQNRTISSLDDYHQISSARHVLYVEDSEAIQYVFQGDTMLYSLEEHGEARLVSETSGSAS
ncbi:hypothetical protein BKA61DRAFT_476617 [Leptodontidium sp. MPI-SDFR-AT-0119]|nr:hypothetical protein BKA61DRAFT_476617 [Leptodontidium sp. MPI-SDFR-AT-0119]